jgi:hypothetical protein
MRHKINLRRLLLNIENVLYCLKVIVFCALALLFGFIGYKKGIKKLKRNI